MNECNPNPCENGANCTVGQLGLLFNYEHAYSCDVYLQIIAGNRYSCACAAGYVGSNCQINVGVQECQLAPCINGGTCHNITNGYTCECRQGYEAS